MPAPTITSTSPASYAGGIPIAATISATFGAAMNAASLTAATFLVSKGSPTAGTVAYNAGTKTATFTPTAVLVYSGTYTVTLTTGVQASDLTPLATPYSWTFTVVALNSKKKRLMRSGWDRER